MNTINITQKSITERLKKLDRNAHKGDNGTLNVVAGCPEFRGAADLCVGAALRTGCGIVRLISDERVVATVSARHPSCTFSPANDIQSLRSAILKRKDEAFLIGCGLSQSEKSSLAVSLALSVAKHAVIDADALNVISQTHEAKALLKGNIITPHVGEFSRLTTLPISDIKDDPIGLSASFSDKYGCVTVLKDSVTVIAIPSGTVYVSRDASEGLSKGGSGDVLAGMIAGFLSQGYSCEDAAVIGVALHAYASVNCASYLGKRGMLPSDLEIYAARLLANLNY